MISSRSSSPSDRFIKPHRPSINQKRPSPPESDSSDDDQFTFSPVHSPALNNGTFTNGSRKFILTPAHEYYYRQKLLSLSRSHFKSINDYTIHVTAIVQKLIAVGIKLTESEAIHAYLRGLPDVTAQAVLSSLESSPSFTQLQVLTHSIEEARQSAVLAGQYAAEKAENEEEETLSSTSSNVKQKQPSRRVRYRSHSVTTHPTSNHLMSALSSTPHMTIARPKSIAFPKPQRPDYDNNSDIEKTPLASSSSPQFTPISPNLLERTANLTMCSPTRHTRTVNRSSPYTSPTKRRDGSSFGLGLGI